MGGVHLGAPRGTGSYSHKSGCTFVGQRPQGLREVEPVVPRDPRGAQELTSILCSSRAGGDPWVPLKPLHGAGPALSLIRKRGQGLCGASRWCSPAWPWGSVPLVSDLCVYMCASVPF